MPISVGPGGRGAFNHNWDPYWSTSLFGSYTGARYDDTAKFYACTIYTNYRAVVHSADYSCNPDFNTAQVGLVTRWTPVKNLTFSAEVMYFRLDQKFTGTANFDPDGSEADGHLRVQGPGRRLSERPRSAQLLILISHGDRSKKTPGSKLPGDFFAGRGQRPSRCIRNPCRTTALGGTTAFPAEISARNDMSRNSLRLGMSENAAAFAEEAGATTRLMHCSKHHLYSITRRHARAAFAGTVRPRALAVLRLIARSYLVGACTGMSAVFSPLRMRST